MEISGVLLCYISARLEPEGTAISVSFDSETTWYTSEAYCLLSGSLIMNCGMGKAAVGVQVSDCDSHWNSLFTDSSTDIFAFY